MLNKEKSADALDLKFNTFLLFFPLSINKLFKCQKYT